MDGDSERRGFGAMLDHAQSHLPFDPIEANFISTILRDCYYQLHNVGNKAEVKPIKLPQLLRAENPLAKLPVRMAKPTKSCFSLSRQFVDPRSMASITCPLSALNPSTRAIAISEEERIHSNLDENSSWLELLVEAHGYLEDTYLSTLERAKNVLEGWKDEQGKPMVNLEEHGIRMKKYELSQAIADRENALNLIAGERVENILTGLKDIILATSEELKHKGTYETLKHRNTLEANAMEKGPKLVDQELHFHDTCKQLIDSIEEEKEQGQRLIKEREVQVANLKDYLKEQKVLRSLEIAYIKKFSEAAIDQVKKMNEKKFQELQEEETSLQQHIRDDAKTNEVMETFLKKQIDKKQQVLNTWILKYEIEVERKADELKEIKERLEKDLDWAETLKKRLVEYEQVIEDDRRIKAIEQNRKDEEKLQWEKAIQIQKWWRGLRVRRCIGPYKKRKQKKGKKDGGSTAAGSKGKGDGKQTKKKK